MQPPPPTNDDLKQSTISIDIWGTCVSRDVIGLADDHRINETIKVNKYYQGCNYTFQFFKHNCPIIDLNEMLEKINFLKKIVNSSPSEFIFY